MSVYISLWRIATDTPLYGADDLSGEGARQSGGRWNRAGIPMLYTGGARSLACLEVLVHLNPKGLPLNRYLVEIRVPMAAWRKRAMFNATTNVGWDAEPYGLVSLDWGSEWQKSGTSLLAQVPSVIVPEESNVLINPEHPDMTQVSATKVRKWTFDPRLGA